MTAHIAVTIIICYSAAKWCDVCLSVWCQLKENKNEKFGDTTPYMTEFPWRCSLEIACLSQIINFDLPKNRSSCFIKIYVNTINNICGKHFYFSIYQKHAITIIDSNKYWFAFFET